MSVRAANARRNARRAAGRHRRWRSSRAAAWTLIDPHLAEGARVAVVGAGNGDDLPLRALGRRAGELHLIDLDERALRRTRRRLRLAGVRAETHVHDVTGGTADEVVRATKAGDGARVDPRPVSLGVAGPLDVVIADLMLSQLLYPALLDAGVSRRATDRALLEHGRPLTDRVVAAFCAAAPVVICVEDVLGWWAGHEQPWPIDELLAVARDDPDRALEQCARGSIAFGCDGRAALQAAGAEIVDRAFWRWPFAPGTDYLVCASVARAPKPPT